MAKDVKIYAGAAEGWVSIGDFASVSTVCGLTDVNCDGLTSSKIMIYDEGIRVDENGDPLPSVDPSFVLQYIGESQIGRPQLGQDWDKNTIGWNFTNAGNLLMGDSLNPGGIPGVPDSPGGEDTPSDWGEGTIGYEFELLRVMIEEGGGGSTPSLPPGEGAGDTYDVRSWSDDAGIPNQRRFLSRDGVFSNGIDWSVDGLQFFRASRTVQFPASIREPVKLTSQGVLYLASDGASFSYDMKNWYAISGWSTSSTSGLKQISSVFVVSGSAYIYGRYKSQFDSEWSLRLLRFNPGSGSWSNQIAGISTEVDNLLAYPFSDSQISSGLYTMFTTHEQNGFVMGVAGNGMRITRIDSQGIATESNALDGTLPCEGMVYGDGKICAKFDNGTRLTTDGISWGTFSTFPQAANYELPDFDDVARWHICGPAGQPVICYGEDTGNTIDWQLVSQEVPSGGDVDAYVTATSGRVIVTQKGSPEYLITGQVDGVYTVDVKLTTTGGEIRSLTSPRLIISNAETQEDANTIFVDRLTNSGNLKLGIPDEADWAVGTIGEALQSVGSGVDFTTEVGVDTTDCNIGPADATGSLTPDGAEVDGVQKYKLDLTLPRPPVVTTSETEPTGACDGDIWFDETGGVVGGGSTVKSYGFYNRLGADTVVGQNISSVSGGSAGRQYVNFETPMKDNQYTVTFGNAWTTSGSAAVMFRNWPSGNFNSMDENKFQAWGRPLSDTNYVTYDSFEWCVHSGDI